MTAKNLNNAAIQWLMDSDPAIRWQVQRDLLAALPAEYAAERAKVVAQGWGAGLLAAQREDGVWGDNARFPEWPTLRTLVLLADMGLEPDSPQARQAVARVRENISWLMGIRQEELPPKDISWFRKPLFEGEVEPCINGRVLAAGAYFGEDMQGLAERLLGEQMADGGWNCEQENGSTRGSFHTTICVLEGLLAYEHASGGSPALQAARQRGEDYLLKRHLLHRLSDNKLIDNAFMLFPYPAGWRFDVLRALDYCRAAGLQPDARMQEAVEAVRRQQQPDGRWLLGPVYEGEVSGEPDVSEGQPSHWNTLRALRVLKWVAG